MTTTSAAPAQVVAGPPLTRYPPDPVDGRPVAAALTPQGRGPEGEWGPWQTLALRAFAVAVLVLGTGAFFDVFEGTGPAGTLLTLLAHGVSAVLLADGLLRSRLRLPWPGIGGAFVVLAVVSVAWSEVPAETLQDAIGLVGTLLFAMLLAQRLSPVAVLDVVRVAMTVVAVASLLLFLSGDGRALDPTHGSLRGVLVAKNSLGQAMALGLVATGAACLLSPSRALRRMVTALPMALALALAGSATSILLAGGGLLCLLVVWVRSRHRLLLPALASLGAAVVLLAIALDRVLSPAEAAALVGRDTTLTGRTDIWPEALAAVAARPLLGYGYGSFWGHTGESADIRVTLGFEVAHAHNGLLDIALEAGLLGAAVVVAALAVLVRAGGRDLSRGRRDVGVLRLTTAGLIVAVNTVETGLYDGSNLLTVLLLVAMCAPHPAARLMRRTPRGRRRRRRA